MSPLSNQIQIIEEIIMVEMTYMKQKQYIIHTCITEGGHHL